MPLRAIPLLAAILLSFPATAQAPFRTNRNAPLPNITTGYDLCVGDVDGDGYVDLVAGNDHDPNQLLLNDGRGGFVDATAGRLVTPSTPFPTGYANATYEVDLADIDGDGDLDLLVVNDHDLPNRVYTNDGLGFFTDTTAIALPNHQEWSVDQVVGDFDNDGDVDWIVCNSNSTRLYLNNGLGMFTDASGNLPAGAVGWSTSYCADLDQDSDLDVVLHGWTPQILVNQGNAVFTLAPAGAIPSNGSTHAADVDGDGDLDLLVGNGSRLLRNLGGLAFAAPVVLPASTWASIDWDLDGDVDLIGTSTLLVNDGTGAFTAVPSGVTLGYGDSVCIADLDGDGDPDVVDAQSDSAGSARFNFLSQVHTPAGPAIGLPYSIQFASPSRTTPVFVIPAVATGNSLSTVPGLYGALRLDPISAIPLWVIPSSTGTDTITWTIPAVPGLVGTELHYQAAVLDPLRQPFLGNWVRDVIQ